MKGYLFVCIIFICLGCEKRFGPKTVPSSLFIVVKQGSERLPDSILNNTKLAYFKSGAKHYVSDFVRGTGEGYTQGIQTSLSIGSLSAEDNIKTYFLEFPGGDQDTLLVDNKSLEDDEAFEHPCYCSYPLEKVEFNGKHASIDSTIPQQRVYLLRK